MGKFSSKPEALLFPAIALIAGLAFHATTPRLAAPDEPSHFHRAFAGYEGHFQLERRDGLYGAQMPGPVRKFLVLSSTRQARLRAGLPAPSRNRLPRLSDSNRRVFTATDRSPYSPVSYLPQILGMHAAPLGASRVEDLYDAGRLAALAFWVTCLGAGLWIVPISRTALGVVGVIPTAAFLAPSFSADSFANGLSFFWTSLCLTLAVDKDRAVGPRELVLLGTVGTLLVLSKYAYTPLLGLALLLRPGPAGRRTLWAATLLVPLCVATAVLLYGWDAKQLSFTPEGSGDLVTALIASASAPMEFVYAVLHAFRREGLNYVHTMIGSFGSGEARLPGIAATAYVAAFALALVRDGSRPPGPSTATRLALISIPIVTTVLIHGLAWVAWTAKGDGIVYGFQGRYLIPLLPCLAVALAPRWPPMSARMDAWMLGLVVVLVGAVEFVAIGTVQARFWE